MDDYSIEYYLNGKRVGQSFELRAEWPALMKALNMRRERKKIPSVFGKTEWNSVNIWVWINDEKVLIKEDMQTFDEVDEIVC